MTAAAGAFDRVAPHCVRDGVLRAADVADLLAFTLAREGMFAPTTIDGPNRVPSFRSSRALPRAAFDPWRDRFRATVGALLPDLIAALGLTRFEPSKFEVELVAHNDGDFYHRHIDTATARPEQQGRRLLSMVYYFHAEPRAYAGGALRLHPFRAGGAFEDVLPEQNRLIAFPSWAPHEVMPISCPSRRFADSRFAVNIWARGLIGGAPAAQS